MITQKHSMDRHHCVKFDNQGYMTLLGVIVLGAIAEGVAISLLLFGLGSSRTSFVVEQSAQARAFADSCAEEALQKIRESVYYQGNETLFFNRGSCEIQTILGTGNANRVIQTVGVAGVVKRKVKITVGAVHPAINTVSWQEVSDF